MTDDTITITAGRPNRQGDEQDFAGPDGTYTVTLVSISDAVTEKSTMPDAKGDGTWSYRDWTVAIVGGEFDGQVLDIRANARATGPKSKQYGMIAAFAGKAPAIGASFSLRALVGREALASIQTNDGGYPFVASLMAVPPARQAAPAPEPEPEPVAVAASGDGLPF